MAGRPCGACALPVVLRYQIVEQRKRLVPLRQLSAELREAGHPLSKDALFRHFENCVAASLLDEPDLGPTISASDDGTMARIVAFAVVDHLKNWPNIARQIHVRLILDGAIEAAEIVAQAIPETMLPGHPLCRPESELVRNVRVRVMVGDFTFYPPETGPWPIPLTTNASPHKEIEQ